MTAVLRNGFCRARFHRDRNVVEFYAGSPAAEAAKRALIARFLREQGIGACVVKNIRRGCGGRPS